MWYTPFFCPTEAEKNMHIKYSVNMHIKYSVSFISLGFLIIKLLFQSHDTTTCLYTNPLIMYFNVCVPQVIWGAIRRPWRHTVSAVRRLPAGPQGEDLPQDRSLDSALQRHHADAVALLQQCFLRCVLHRHNKSLCLYFLTYLCTNPPNVSRYHRNMYLTCI